MTDCFHVLIDLIADLTEPKDLDMDARTERSRRIREAHDRIDAIEEGR